MTRAVARLGRESAVEPGDAFVDLVWHPDEARADFGEVDVLYGGAVQRMRRFVPDFPYSNIGLAQLMPGENAECACQALLDLFEWLGGVPERIVFDDAAGVGRGTRLFQAFQARYGFESSLCSPYAGHEKGAVEAKVGMIRRKLFVPGQVPGARREAPPRQGRGGGGPVRGGPQGPAAPAVQTLRRGHVETHEGRQARRGHA